MVITESDLALQGANILVTRPLHQADSLCRMIAAHGGNALQFPSIDILSAEIDAELASCISDVSSYDIAIFVSANAVDFGLNLVSTWPPKTAIAAIGAASARALSGHGLRPSITPKTDYNSEALLAEPEMQQVSGKRILIFRGVGGREHLAEQLVERGAVVHYAECYRRVLPQPSSEQRQQLNSLCRRGEIHAITATSNESLQNLFKLFEENKTCLQQATIIGVSQRLLSVAKSLGLAQPRIAAQPSDAAVVDELIAWRSEMLAMTSQI